MRKKINIIIGAFIAILSGCKPTQKTIMQQQQVVTLYGVPYATYHIKGTVTDTDNQPLKDMQVVVKGYKKQVIGDTISTNKKGAFEATVSDFPTDTLHIVVQDPNAHYDTDSTAIALPQAGSNARGFYRGEYHIETDIQLKK